jgi:hypothetical protein
VYLWKLGVDKKSAVRLTFHTSNDRWPDLYLGRPKQAVPATEAVKDTAKKPVK